MKRETAIILLSCFKKFNIDLKTMERVLRRSDALLECLITSGAFEMSMNIIDCYSDDTDAIEALGVLKKLRFKETYLMLTNKQAIMNGNSIKLAKLINCSNHSFTAKYSYQVLTNDKILEAGITSKALEFVASCGTEKSALELYALLSNDFLLSEGITIKVLGFISLRSYNMLPIVNYILGNFSFSDNDELFELLKLIFAIKDIRICDLASKVLCNKTLINLGISLECVRIISGSKKWQSAQYAYNFLINTSSRNSESILSSVQEICSCATTDSAQAKCYELINKDDNDNPISRIISELEDSDQGEVNPNKLLKALKYRK